MAIGHDWQEIHLASHQNLHKLIRTLFDPWMHLYIRWRTHTSSKVLRYLLPLSISCLDHNRGGLFLYICLSIYTSEVSHMATHLYLFLFCILLGAHSKDLLASSLMVFDYQLYPWKHWVSIFYQPKDRKTLESKIFLQNSYSQFLDFKIIIFFNLLLAKFDLYILNVLVPQIHQIFNQMDCLSLKSILKNLMLKFKNRKQYLIILHTFNWNLML